MKKIIIITLSLYSLIGCTNNPMQPIEQQSPAIKTTITTKEETIRTDATFVGLIDPHTIEVMINHQPFAIQINQQQLNLFETLPTNARLIVEYKYKEQTGQPILVSISVQEI